MDRKHFGRVAVRHRADVPLQLLPGAAFCSCAVAMRPNISANTDPQQQKAASPQLLRSGCLGR